MILKQYCTGYIHFDSSPIVEKMEWEINKIETFGINDYDAKSLMMMILVMIAKDLSMTMTTMMMLTMMTMMLVREKWL